MPTTRGKRLVLNAHRLFRDVAPAVMAEQAEQSLATFAGGWHDPLLYPVISQGQHKLIVTRAIRDAYSRESTRRGGPGSAFLARVLQHLEVAGLLIDPRLPAGAAAIPGLRQHHRVFPETAIRSEANYLVTRNPQWLADADWFLKNYRLRVVLPGQFVELEG